MKAELDAQDLAKKLTVTVEIKRYNQWLVRLWIAKQLIRLAGFVAWVDVEFSDRDKDKEDDSFCNWLVERNRYRLMILQLLEGAPDTNIPQEARNKAYDLLDEYFIE